MLPASPSAQGYVSLQYSSIQYSSILGKKTVTSLATFASWRNQAPTHCALTSPMEEISGVSLLAVSHATLKEE